jgi:phage terminase Nu1 subunit (DNA packaging protein)
VRLYTANVVADWLALTPRRVRQLRDEGVLVEAAPGLYDMKPTVARYIMYLRKGSRADFNDERALLTRAKREAADMENEHRRGNLHRTEDIEKGLATMCLNIRSRLSSLPAKLSGELAQMGGDRAGIFDKLKSAIDEALEELSNYDAAMAVAETEAEKGGDDEAGKEPL